MKKYKQPAYMGGKEVLAKDVPNHYYSIHFPDEMANESNEIEILKHENSPCMTRSEIDELFNAFRTKKQVQEAKKDIVNVLKHY